MASSESLRRCQAWQGTARTRSWTAWAGACVALPVPAGRAARAAAWAAARAGVGAAPAAGGELENELVATDSRVRTQSRSVGTVAGTSIARQQSRSTSWREATADTVPR